MTEPKKPKSKRAARPHFPPQELMKGAKIKPESPDIPEAEAENMTETEETLAEALGDKAPLLGGFDLAGAIKLAQPLIDQAVADNLSKMNLPDLIQGAVKEHLAPTIATINTVKEQLKPLIDAAQQMSGSNGNGSSEQGRAVAVQDNPGPSQGFSLPPINAIRDIISLFKPSNPGGGSANIAQLSEMLKGVQTIAELANAPYRQGRNDALQETNATMKLLRGVGASDEKTQALIEEATRKGFASE